MNVLGLFDGMSCAQQALERSGIKVDNYFASEIDKYAIKATMHNYPNTIQLGSVVDLDCSKLPSIGMLLGGSPCQSFSFAGKRKGMSTICEIEILTLEHYLKLKSENYQFEGQSYLFWEYMRILKEVKPKYFLLENVKMGEKWEKVLSKAIGVNPIEINSALVSAQSRRRLYWTNIGMEPGGLFGDLQSIIKQPKDRGILLKDILEKEVDAKYFLSDKALEGIYKHAQRQEENGNGFGALPKSENEKMNALHIGGKGKDDLVRIDKRANTSVQKDNLVFTKNYLQWDSTGKGHKSQQDRAFYEDNKCGTIPLSRTETKVNILQGGKIRRLTPKECCRLQTVADNFFEGSGVSETQQYKMLGNGWTIEVIVHILSYVDNIYKKHNN